MRWVLACASVLVLVGCGGSDDAALFGGSGAGGQDAGVTGGSGGSGAVGGVGATGGVGGTGATGGAGGTAASGGSAGAAASGGTGATGGDPGTGGTGATGGTGGATSLGLCAGHCGSGQPVTPENCYCDEACVNSNDCCPDYGATCHKVAGPGQVTCGSTTCSTATDFCCQQFTGAGLSPKCQTGGTQCQGPDIYCDGPDDCGSGQVCCSTVVQQNNVNFECKLPADCSDPSQRIVCGNDASVCQTGQKCVPHPWVPQYNYCAVN
ncbi:MAG: hypothetical protein KC776_26495 [Myxococcales bacterium]|nr:hypothetical protein [Myxococcales bacterium]